MKKTLLLVITAVLIVSLLAGCGEGEKAAASSQSIPEKVSSAPSEASSAPQSAVPAVPSAEPKPSSAAPASSSQPEAPVETFDAAAAVSVEEIDNGIKVIFNQLPQTAQDMEALFEVYSRSDSRNVSAFFLASLVRYVDSPDDAFAMIDVLRGPQPMSDADKSFMKERLGDKLYLPRAYFEGAVPKNEYQPDEPWTLIIYDDPVAPPEGYGYTQVKTSGADNSRRIVTRLKDDQNYLWEYNGALLSIRLPASEDPWA